jgi:hypothetical protein
MIGLKKILNEFEALRGKLFKIKIYVFRELEDNFIRES